MITIAERLVELIYSKRKIGHQLHLGFIVDLMGITVDLMGIIVDLMDIIDAAFTLVLKHWTDSKVLKIITRHN